jgi:elongation factor P
MHDNQPITVQLPETLIMEVIEADPVIRGQTASSSYKPAVLENGRRIMVPPHIEAGTKIVVNTTDGTYAEKAK